MSASGEVLPARNYFDALIALLFAVLYAVLAAFLALVGSVHGPKVFPYSVLACLMAAEAALWAWFFFLRRRAYRRKTWMLLAGAVALGAAMAVGANATWGPLVDREFAQQERLAATTEVTGMQDELLLSPQGDPIGVRLRYSVRFPVSDYFWQSAGLEAGNNLGVGVWADGRRISEVAEPPLLSAGPGVRRYEKDKSYSFTTDFIPNFLMWNQENTRLCIVDPPPEYAAAFRELISKGSPLRYTITISGTKYQGATQNAYDLRSFYESAEKEGATHLPGSGFGGATSSCQ